VSDFNPTRDWSRDMSDFRATIDFISSWKEDARHFDKQILKLIFDYGEMKPEFHDNGDLDKVVFKYDHYGVEYYLLTAWCNEFPNERVIITGWPYLRDKERAKMSGEWSSIELATISKFNAMSGGGVANEYEDYFDWMSSEEAWA
jgi:hypothetical protein